MHSASVMGARVILLAIALTTGGGGMTSSSQTPPLSLNPWMIRYSPGMPSAPAANGAGGFVFPIPLGGRCPAPPTQPPDFDISACHHVDYVTRTPMPLSQTITLVYTIAGSNPAFGSFTAATNTCDTPPSVSILIEHTNDAALNVPYYRWWALETGPITLGTHTLKVPLTFANWIDTIGQHGAQVQFEDTLENLGAVGITLGGGCARGHGLYLNSGSATFTINSFTSP